jgi:hypothetical protein
MDEISIVGVDLAKQVFQIHGVTGKRRLDPTLLLMASAAK